MTHIGTFEMFWDCDACGTKKLLGVSHRNCPNCGKAQDAKARYFPAEGEAIAIKDHVYSGADWICLACSHPNSNRARFCASCGCGAEGAQSAKFIQKVEPEPAIQAQPVPKNSNVEREISFKEKVMRKVKKAGIICGVLVVLMFVFYPRTSEGVVKSHRWERIIKIEQKTRRTDSVDCSQVRGEMQIVNSRMVERTKEVKDGEDCQEVCNNVDVDQGDGSFKVERKCRQECRPKYVEQSYTVKVCDVEFPEWKVNREVRSQGNSVGDRIDWPKVELSDGLGLRQMFNRGFGQERKGQQIEKYVVLIDRKGKLETCEVSSLQTWKNYAVGMSLKLKSTVIGGSYCPQG